MSEKVFKVIIAGSRTLDNVEKSHVEMSRLVLEAIETLMPDDCKIIEIVSGGARGADRFGEEIAEENSFLLKRFLPKWTEFEDGDLVKYNTYGKPYNPLAGHRRNEKMGDYADALIALWDLKSKGTKHMINYIKKLKKPFVLIKI